MFLCISISVYLLHFCIFLFLFLCISVSVSVYLCASISVCTLMCTCVCVCICFCVCVFPSVCVFLCMYVCMYLCMYVCTCLSVHLGTSEKSHLTWTSHSVESGMGSCLGTHLRDLAACFHFFLLASSIPSPTVPQSTYSPEQKLSVRLLFIFSGKTCPVFPEAAGTWPQRVG